MAAAVLGISAFGSVPVTAAESTETADIGEAMAVDGESHIDEVAKELGIDVLGKLPLDPKYAQAADEGRFFELENPNLEAGVEKIGNI